MRFTSIFTGLVAAVSTAQAGVIGARAPAAGSNTQMTRRTMHEFGPRAIVEGTVCVTLPRITVEATVAGITADVAISTAVCLCTQLGVLTDESLVDLRNSIRVDLIAGLGLGDVDAILALVLQDVTGEVAGAPAECNYPEGSIPRCASPTSDAGCPFECAPETPVLCDGVCVAADVDCPTAAFGRRSQTSARVCPKSWVACPVYGGTRTEWECVDVAGDLESCGGCATLLHQGVDCTALPGVNDVKCVAGQCQASSCLRGFTLDGKSTCITDTSVKTRSFSLF